MTQRERQIYAVIKDYITDKKYPPSIREICSLVGISSTSTVHRYLVSIKRQGYISFESSKPRTLRVSHYV